MAEYIKFRITAAKAGVTMALLALIGGIAAKEGPDPPTLNATPTAASGFLKLGGITGGTRNAFVKLEAKFLKLDSALASFEKKLAKSYYSANRSNATFLKIADASKKYLKITDAANTFLKIDDASAKFLKIDGTAADSGKLGGLSPNAFVQGKGGIVSGSVQNVGATPVSLLQTSDGKLAVAISGNNQSLTLTFTNNTGGALDYVSTSEQSAAPGVMAVPAVQRGTITPGQNPGLTLPETAPSSQIHMQIFPNASSQEVLTLTISGEPGTPGVGGAPTVNAVGQLLIGLL